MAPTNNADEGARTAPPAGASRGGRRQVCPFECQEMQVSRAFSLTLFFCFEFSPPSGSIHEQARYRRGKARVDMRAERLVTPTPKAALNPPSPEISTVEEASRSTEETSKITHTTPVKSKSLMFDTSATTPHPSKEGKIEIQGKPAGGVVTVSSSVKSVWGQGPASGAFPAQGGPRLTNTPVISPAPLDSTPSSGSSFSVALGSASETLAQDSDVSDSVDVENMVKFEVQASSWLAKKQGMGQSDCSRLHFSLQSSIAIRDSFS